MNSSAPRKPSSPRARRNAVRVVLALGMTLLLAGCAAGANSVAGAGESAGFWLGLWQGFIAPIAFVVSLFNHAVGIYEVHNSGAWYDFGYVVGLSAFFSGPVGARRRNRALR